MATWIFATDSFRSHNYTTDIATCLCSHWQFAVTFAQGPIISISSLSVLQKLVHEKQVPLVCVVACGMFVRCTLSPLQGGRKHNKVSVWQCFLCVLYIRTMLSWMCVDSYSLALMPLLVTTLKRPTVATRQYVFVYSWLSMTQRWFRTGGLSKSAWTCSVKFVNSIYHNIDSSVSYIKLPTNIVQIVNQLAHCTWMEVIVSSHMHLFGG